MLIFGVAYGNNGTPASYRQRVALPFSRVNIKIAQILEFSQRSLIETAQAE